MSCCSTRGCARRTWASRDHELERYAAAFTDWLACAYAGRDEPAARSARDAGSELQDRLVSAGTAGHVLDFDGTYLPGLSHLSCSIPES